MEVVTRPATTMTREQFERGWKPRGWELLVIGPTATWRQEWGEWEAIRDIVQNALDEAEAYQWGYDEGLWISDEGRGVQVADFLLGPPKLKPDWARGKFGEGMKIAALALLRKGYSVKVDTIGKELWMIFLQQKVNGRADTLAAMWRPNGTTRGTRLHIIGYFGDAFADRFAVNLRQIYILHQGPSTLAEPVQRYNQLISEPMGQTRIFARDIYFREIESPFSYNLWSFEMAPDRHGPKSEQDMYVDMGRLWCTVTDVDLLDRFLGMVKDPPDEDRFETRFISMDGWSMGTCPVSKKRYDAIVEENGDAWRAAWRRRCGDNAVIRTTDRWDGTVRHLGYEPVSLGWNVQPTLAKVIKTDIALVKESQERLRGVQPVPDHRLSERQLAHLTLARAIAERFRFSRIEGVHAAIIPPASDRMRTAGLYQRTTQEIFIAIDQLEKASWTVDTVIHEIAHHTSGAEDAEEAHNAEMPRVAATVVELTAAGRYDEILKEAIW